MNFPEPENTLKYGYREILIKHSTIQHTKFDLWSGHGLTHCPGMFPPGAPRPANERPNFSGGFP